MAIHQGSNDAKYYLKNTKPGAIMAWLDEFEVRALPH